MENKKLEKVINESIELFRENHLPLLKNNVNERSITHKLAECILEVSKRSDNLKDYDIDCEYNRFKDYTKKIDISINKVIKIDDLKAVTIYPDIIIHKRGVQDRNLLVIEVKKSTNKDKQAIAFDKEKLKVLKNDPYKYEHTLHLIIDMGGDNDKMDWSH